MFGTPSSFLRCLTSSAGNFTERRSARCVLWVQLSLNAAVGLEPTQPLAQLQQRSAVCSEDKLFVFSSVSSSSSLNLE